MKILRYIILKTGHSPRDAFWTVNTVALALETALLCHELKKWSEMEWCLNEADYYQQFYPNRLPAQLQAPSVLNRSQLVVLRMLWSYEGLPDREDLVIAQVRHLNSIELNPCQGALVAALCFNVGLDLLNQNDYASTIDALKSSHRFGEF